MGRVTKGTSLFIWKNKPNKIKNVLQANNEVKPLLEGGKFSMNKNPQIMWLILVEIFKIEATKTRFSGECLIFWDYMVSFHHCILYFILWAGIKSSTLLTTLSTYSSLAFQILSIDVIGFWGWMLVVSRYNKITDFMKIFFGVTAMQRSCHIVSAMPSCPLFSIRFIPFSLSCWVPSWFYCHGLLGG